MFEICLKFVQYAGSGHWPGYRDNGPSHWPQLSSNSQIFLAEQDNVVCQKWEELLRKQIHSSAAQQIPETCASTPSIVN